MEKRRKRVNIDKNVEVLIVNNSNSRIILNNNKLSTPIDLEEKGDEEYITVGELRTLVNTNRKMFEGFKLIVADILDDDLTLEDLFTFVGLEKAYNEYFSLRPNSKDKSVSTDDIDMFILKSNANRFEEILNGCSVELKHKIIFTAIEIFRDGELNDYAKMQVLRKFTDEDLFDDLEITREYMQEN